MPKKSDLVKIENVIKYLNDIDLIIFHHESVDQALLDNKDQYAIKLCLMQISEKINTIEDESIISKLTVPEIVSFRNRVVHNYKGTDLVIIKKIIFESLPELKKTLSDILKSS